jgi:hypothetical protein
MARCIKFSCKVRTPCRLRHDLRRSRQNHPRTHQKPPTGPNGPKPSQIIYIFRTRPIDTRPLNLALEAHPELWRSTDDPTQTLRPLLTQPSPVPPRRTPSSAPSSQTLPQPSSELAHQTAHTLPAQSPCEAPPESQQECQPHQHRCLPGRQSPHASPQPHHSNSRSEKPPPPQHTPTPTHHRYPAEQSQ